MSIEDGAKQPLIPNLPPPITFFDKEDWPHRSWPQHNEVQEAFQRYNAIGDAECALFIAFQYMADARWEDGVLWLNAAAKGGDKDAMAIIGAFYMQGTVLKKNEFAALYWIQRSGSIISDFANKDPRKLAKDIAGKSLMLIEIERHIEDPADPESIVFYGRPSNRDVSIPIHPDDIEGECTWSAPKFVQSSRMDGSGYWTQSTRTHAYFPLEVFAAVKKKMNDDTIRMREQFGMPPS